MATLMSYSETNYTNGTLLNAGGTDDTKVGQAVTLNACGITDVKFYLKKDGSPTGNATAVLSTPTGIVHYNARPITTLATSSAYDVSGLTTSYQLIDLNFATPYVHAGGDICIEIDYAGGSHVNTVYMGYDATSATDPGNMFEYDGSTWGIDPITYACIYYILGTWKPSAFALSLPANAATGQATAGTLSWVASADATTYDVYLDQNNPPTTKVSADQAGITYDYSGLSGGANYFWKVVAKGVGGTTNCNSNFYFVTGAPLTTPPSKSRGISAKGQVAGAYDYGQRTYASKAEGYLGYSGEITKQYVESMGFTYKDADYKKPYLHEDYHSMVYLFTTPHTEITGEAYGGKRLVFGGDLPRVNDQYFDNSPQVASLANFNSYARENYLIMGKGYPAAAIQRAIKAGAVPVNVTSESIMVAPENKYYDFYKVLLGGTLTLSVLNFVYAQETYLWSIAAGNVGDGVSHVPRYLEDKGSINKPNGYNVTYTAPSIFPTDWNTGVAYIIINLYLLTLFVGEVSIRVSDATHY